MCYLNIISFHRMECLMMPKKEHVHVVTDLKHKQILERLGQRFGSMTKAFEYAIETLEKNETIGSCDNCEIKHEYNQINTFSELLNTVTFTHDNIQELVRYLQGDCTIQELLIRSREKARHFTKQYLIEFVQISFEDTYDNLVTALEDWKKRTRLFKSVQVDKYEKLIIARVNILEKLPIFVATGLIGYLEALGFTFDLDILDENLIIKWLTPEKYSQEKIRIEEKITNFINDSDQYIQPYFIKQGYLPSSPEFLDWVSGALLDHEVYPMDISYRFINRTLGTDFVPPKSAKEWVIILTNILKSVNYVEYVKTKVNEEKNTFKLSLVCRTRNLTHLLLQNAITIMSKFGWKLKSHRIDHKTLDFSMYYVGEDDPDILQPLYIINFVAFLNQRFQKLRSIPVDEYEDLTKTLYKLNPEELREVFIKQGKKFAEAIKLLAKNDLSKMREIGLKVIPQLIRTTQRDPNQISMVAEPNKFNIIFKTTDPVEMLSLTSIFVAVMEGFGYYDIKDKIKGNMVIIEFKRPQEIEIPVPKIEIK